VVKPDSICVRSERPGSEKDSRKYTVEATARDAAGNETTATAVIIEVPHDQRPPDRCIRDYERFVPRPTIQPAWQLPPGTYAVFVGLDGNGSADDPWPPVVTLEAELVP
jgi:hypothetical protein